MKIHQVRLNYLKGQFLLRNKQPQSPKQSRIGYIPGAVSNNWGCPSSGHTHALWLLSTLTYTHISPNGILLQALPRMISVHVVEVATCRAPLGYKAGPL